MNNRLDLLYLSRRKLPLASHSLSCVSSYFNIDYSSAHRAMADCRITYECYLRLIELPGTNSGLIKSVSSGSVEKPQRPAFSMETKALQELRGFLLGIIADEQLMDSEILALDKWLIANNYLAGNYPFDRVFSLVQNVLSDGIVTSEERDGLMRFFTEFTNPIESLLCKPSSCDQSIVIHGNHFCLTGNFTLYDKAALSLMIETNGGICDKNVTKSTNYLVVGGNGSSDWSCGSYGNKVKKALEYRDKGIPVEIIKEDLLLSSLNGR